MTAINSEFEVGADGVTFTTKTNGDYVELKGFHFDAENAANLATLINSETILSVEIKAKEE